MMKIIYKYKKNNKKLKFYNVFLKSLHVKKNNLSLLQLFFSQITLNYRNINTFKTMQNKLQELTEKLYQEGITKGQSEAEKIINQAKEEARQIIENAKKEAETIITDAKKKSEEFLKNAQSEFKLSSRQALNALKQQITNIISDEILKQVVPDIIKNKDFLNQIILTAVKNWILSSENAGNLELIVSPEDEKNVKEFFFKSAKELLDKGLVIKPSPSLKSGFQISPADGSYRVNFTEEDFINYFKEYLRPRLLNLLFNE